MGKIFKFKKEVGWAEILSLIAIVLTAYLFYLQFSINKEKISLIEDKSYYCYFKDIDGRKKYFHAIRGIVVNNGNKPVTLLGLSPILNTNMLLGTRTNTNKADKLRIPFKIFQIPDSTSFSDLFKDDTLIWKFKNQGQDKFSNINKHLNPGEAYFLNIGIILDLYSGSKKSYNNIVFISEIRFSNNQKISFGANTTLKY